MLAKASATIYKWRNVLRLALPIIILGVILVWEIVEHTWIDADDIWFFTATFDILLVGLLAGIVYLFASWMEHEIAMREAIRQELRERNQTVMALYSLTTQINQSRNLNTILNIALEQALQLTRMDGGAIWLTEEQNHTLYLKAHRGLDETVRHALQRLPADEGLNGLALRQKGQVTVPNLPADSRLEGSPLQKTGFQSGFFVSLSAPGGTVGTFAGFTLKAHTFTLAEQNLLTAIAAQVGVAVESARLYQSAQQRLFEITILQGIAWLTNSSLNLHAMLQTVVQALEEVFRHESYTIFLREDGRLVPAIHHGSPSPSPGATMLAEKAVATGSPAFPPTQMDDFIQDGVPEISLPLKARQTVIGALNVCAGAEKTLSPNEVRLFTALATQISVGIHNARLYAEVMHLNEELQKMIAQRTRELEAARQEVTQKAHQLQQLLLEVTRIQDEERNRIAFDMHDGVTQLVIGAMYECQAAVAALDAKPAMAHQKLQAVQDLLQQVKDEIHQIVHNLHTPGLETTGLIPALKRYIASYRQLVGIPCQLHISGEPFSLNPDVETAIYRIVQEALHNVGRHADATSSNVFIDFGLRNVRIVIQDDGKGMDVETALNLPDTHLGLRSMQQRARQIGGELEVQSAPRQGTQVILKIPRP
ncbi:MAG: GAF domain-containing protein [Caldilineae bacterium]|nr:MAG: GAF domain-containing protein [Caldilineae bacterium]